VRVGLALAAGLLVITTAAVLTLAHAPLALVREGALRSHTKLVTTTGPASACQAHEVLPQGTAAIRLGLTTDLGPRVTVKVLSHSQVITQGTHPPGWEGASVTVPVRPLARAFAPVTVCARLGALNGPVAMLGLPTPAAQAAVSAGKALPGELLVEDLRPDPRSWWSMANAIAWRFSIGRAASGPWNAMLVLALAAMLVTLSAWLLTRELR
jgi:hypothetical protein